MLRGDDKIALIFATFIIDEHNGSAGSQIVEHLRNRTETGGGSHGKRYIVGAAQIRWQQWYLHGMAYTIDDLCRTLDHIAPPHLAAQWDNVGLLLGSRHASLSSAMLCIDLTLEVATEAIAAGVQAVVAYHPPIFDGITALTDASPEGARLLMLAQAGIAVFSPHTAIDAAPDGITDWLASGIGDGTTQPLEHALGPASTQSMQVITYVPRDTVDAVHHAMSQAGAGHIGAYSLCSTRIESTGTFKGSADTSPALGQADHFETVSECRLMMVCGESDLPEVIAAVRASHPYEEPPIHIVALTPQPIGHTGSGRALHLSSPSSTDEIAAKLKQHLGVDSLRIAEPANAVAHHEIAGCCPGAGGSMISEAQRCGATLFLTGEMRHHDLLAAIERGMTVILAGHTNSERGYLPILQQRLSSLMADCVFSVSRADVALWTSR